jgi:hypothetical protein
LHLLRQNGGHRAREHGLHIDVTKVTTAGAKTTEEVARAVAKARSKRITSPL